MQAVCKQCVSNVQAMLFHSGAAGTAGFPETPGRERQQDARSQQSSAAHRRLPKSFLLSSVAVVPHTTNFQANVLFNAINDKLELISWKR